MNAAGARRQPALRAIGRELGARYGGDYRVVSEDSAAGAERALRALHEAGEDVAVVLADHRLAEASGAELLARARQLHPLAKRALLVPWGAWRDRATAAAAGPPQTAWRRPSRCVASALGSAAALGDGWRVRVSRVAGWAAMAGRWLRAPAPSSAVGRAGRAAARGRSAAPRTS